jgi:hypothetical protein
MRKWLWLLLAFPAMAQTTQVSGKLQTYTPNIAPNALGNYVEFQLTNCGNNTPTVSGSAVLLSKAVDFYPDSTGALTAAANGGLTPRLYGNDVINCGGAFTSRYSVRYYVGGIPQGPAKFYFITSTVAFDLTTATPINLQPPLSPPYPNLTTCAPGSYASGLNKDLSVKCLNLPDGASNAVVTNPTATQEIANQPLVLDGPLSGQTGTFVNMNGAVNATTFPGGDLGVQVNNALATCTDAAPCHVFIPPGVYSYSTTITLPSMQQGLDFTCDRLATLTFTGTGDALRTSVAVNGGGNQGGMLIDGGCKIAGSAAANSGLHIRAGQNIAVTGATFSGFTNGDGIWVDGANVVSIDKVTSKGNQNGIHLTGNTCNGANVCTWDRNSSGAWFSSGAGGTSAFAPNAIKVYRSQFSSNSHWGAIVDDVVGGSVSAGFANAFIDDTFESNGSGGQYGGALIGLATATRFQGNYFEGNVNGIMEGCVGGTPSYVTGPTGYSAQFCGTAVKTTVSQNFFNDPSSADEVYYNFAASPSTDDNVVNSNAKCLVDTGTTSGNVSLKANTVLGSGSLQCQGGTPGGSLTNYIEEGDVANSEKHFHGTTTVDGTFSAGTLTQLNTGQSTMPVGGVIILKLGSINVWQGSTPPAGTCGANPNIWFTNTDMYICSGTWRLVTHS